MTLQKMRKVVAGGLVLSGLLFGGGTFAAELDWHGNGVAPAGYQEPLGGRIDSTPAVRQVAAQEEGGPSRAEPRQSPMHRGAPSRMTQHPVRPASAQGATWQASPAGRVPGYQQMQSRAPWQNRGGSMPEPRIAARGRTQGSITYAPDGPIPQSMMDGEVIESSNGEIVEGMPGELVEGDGFDDGFDSDCGPCGSGCDIETDCSLFGNCPQCPPGCIPAPQWPRNIDVFAGVQGFKGPLDQGRNGNFGFHEGFNIGGKMWLVNCVSYQIGANWVQSNFNGDRSTGQFRDEGRDQVFATGGLFFRPTSCIPWQGGVVVDWLNDDYYIDYNVTQVRAELSRVFCFAEFGFMGAFRAKEADVTFGTIDQFTVQTVDQYCLFLRRHFECCGEGRIWGGVTGDGDGLVGADFRQPLSDSFLLQGNFNYLIANEGGQEGQIEDSWGIMLELVFQPFCRARRSMCDRNRPLFGVADNSRMFVESK